jgi:hypothetical protein
MACHPLCTPSPNPGLTGEKYPLYKGAAPKNREIVRPKIIPDNPQVGTVKTDETGFGGFVTMPLGIFAESIATKR